MKKISCKTQSRFPHTLSKKELPFPSGISQFLPLPKQIPHLPDNLRPSILYMKPVIRIIGSHIQDITLPDNIIRL